MLNTALTFFESSEQSPFSRLTFLLQHPSIPPAQQYKIQELFFQCLNQHPEAAIQFYQANQPLFDALKAIPGLAIQVKRASQQVEKSHDVNYFLTLFQEKLSLEKCPEYLIPIFIHVGDMNELAALLLTLLRRGVACSQIIYSGILFDLIKRDSFQIDEVRTLYHLLKTYPEAHELIDFARHYAARTTVDQQHNKSLELSNHALDGKQRNHLLHFFTTHPYPFRFTETVENFTHLYEVFAEYFLKEALQADAGIPLLTEWINAGLDKEEKRQQLSKFIRLIANASDTRLLGKLSQLITPVTVAILINHHERHALYLLPYNHHLVETLSSAQLIDFVRLLKESPDYFETIPQLIALLKSLEKSDDSVASSVVVSTAPHPLPPGGEGIGSSEAMTNTNSVRQLLFTTLFEIFSKNPHLLDDDVSQALFEVAVSYKDLLEKEYQTIEATLVTSIRAALQTPWSQSNYQCIVDSWESLLEKIGLLEPFLTELQCETTFPANHYFLLRKIVDVYLESHSADSFDLMHFLTTLFPLPDAKNASISPFEQALIFIFAGTRNDVLSDQMLTILNNPSICRARWFHYPYPEGNVFQLTISADNVGNLLKLLTIPNACKKSQLSYYLTQSSRDNRQKTVELICGLQGDLCVSKSDIFLALMEATNRNNVGIVKYLCRITDERKVTVKEINYILELACSFNQREIVNFLCNEQTETRPDGDGIIAGIERAAASGFLDIVSFLVPYLDEVTSKNRLLLTALVKATKGASLPTVEYLYKITSHGEEVLSELMDMAIYEGHFDIIKFFAMQSLSQEGIYHALLTTVYRKKEVADEFEKGIQQTILAILCQFNEKNIPSQHAIHLILQHACTIKKWHLVTYLCELTTDNKPDRAMVTSTLKTAIDEGAIEVIQAILSLQGENRPELSISELKQLIALSKTVTQSEEITYALNTELEHRMIEHASPVLFFQPPQRPSSPIPSGNEKTKRC